MNINLNFNSIKIIEIKYLRTNNIWNYDNTLQILIDIGDFQNIKTNQLGNLSEYLVGQIPSLTNHKCGTGEIGGFITRVNEGITVAHLLEHIIIELSSFALNWKSGGKTRRTEKEGYYYIAIYCGIVDENVMIECVNCGLEILQNIFNKKKFLLYEYKKRIFSKYEHINHNKFLYLFLNRTKYPFIYKNDYNYIQIGYGINQHRILNGFFDSSNSIGNSILSNEDYYKSILQEFNIMTVKTFIANSFDECVDIFNQIKSPVILKPYYKKKSFCGFKINFNNLNNLKNNYNYSISQNSTQSSKVIIQKYYGYDHDHDYDHDLFSSIIINNKLICTYKLDFTEKTIELIGNGTNNIIELINENSTYSFLLNDNPNKFYFENDLFCDNDYLYEYLEENNIDIRTILNINQKIIIKKRFIYPTEIYNNNIGVSIQKKLLLPSQILNLGYYEIKYFIKNNKINSDMANNNIIVLNIKQNLNICLASSCTKYYSKIFDEFFNPSRNYDIPIIGIIGTGNKSFINKIITNFFISINIYTCSCDELNYYINGTNTNLNKKYKWENIELALVNNKTEVLIFNTDTNDYINEGIYCNNYNPVILGNVNPDFDDYYYSINYKPNTHKLLASFVENYDKNGFIVLNLDDPNIFDFINYCKEKNFISKPKFIFYTVRDYQNVLLQTNNNISNNLLELNSIVYIKNNVVYLKNYLGNKDLVPIPIDFGHEQKVQIVQIISSIWSIYDLFTEDKKKNFVDFYNKMISTKQLFL